MARYRGRHLRARPKKRTPVVVGTATALWIAGPARAATYEVRRGETLSSIAARFGSTVAALAAANNLRDPNLIIAGQRLRVPARVRVSSTHMVAPGETLSSIAARYGTAVKALARMNQIKDVNFIVAGSSLRVPALSGAAPTAGPRAPQAVPAANVEASLERHARSHGVEVALAKAVAWQESGWQQDVVSSAGAVGVMQVMPDTADFVNTSLGGGGLDLSAADDNVRLGVMYLRHMGDQMPTLKRALAAYFTGPGNVGAELTAEQQHYAANVLSLMPRFR